MKFKANILIITLFLLMMSSLSALLVSAYINNLIKFSASFHNYYRGYYIANAGLELALVKTNGNVRGYGFEDTVAASSTTVSNNFSGANMSFTVNITSSGAYLGDTNTSSPSNTDVCNNTNLVEMGYKIPPGGCVPIILLQDYSGIGNSYSGSEGKIVNIVDTELKVLSANSGLPSITLYGDQVVTALLTRVDDNFNFAQGRSKEFSQEAVAQGQINLLSQFDPDLSNLPHQQPTTNDKLILMIANTSSFTGHYCIASNVAIPTQYVTIDAQGTYSNVTLDLKGVRTAGLPADFCYTAISS